MMRLYCCRRTINRHRLNYIRVNSALAQPFNFPDLTRFLLKNIYKNPAYSFAFALGVGNSFQSVNESLTCINSLNIKTQSEI